MRTACGERGEDLPIFLDFALFDAFVRHCLFCFVGGGNRHGKGRLLDEKLLPLQADETRLLYLVLLGVVSIPNFGCE